MSSDDFISLHDVYQGLSDDEKCQKTSYIAQFSGVTLVLVLMLLDPTTLVLPLWKRIQ